MAYITPNSTIQLMRAVPLTRDYKNTFYFASVLEQEAYFSNYTTSALTFNNQMYQKPNKNSIRLQFGPTDDDVVLTCNYMRFKNTGFSSMWFYAFITGFERININVVEFTYEIDVIQSYYINSFYRLGSCYVEREHSKSDNVGENIVPEPVTVNEHILDDENTILGQGQTHYYVLMLGLTTLSSSSTNPVLNRSSATGYYSGYRYLIFTDPATLQSWLNSLTISDGIITGLFGNADWSIEGCFSVPSTLINESVLVDGVYLADANAKVSTVSYPRPNTVNGYEPRNRKLLTHPYIFCRVNCVTNENDFKYENFTSSGDVVNPQFRCICTLNPEPSVTVMPLAYENSDRPELATSCANFPVVNIHQSGFLSGIGRHIGQIGKSALQSIAKILSVSSLSAMKMEGANTVYNDISSSAVRGASESIQKINAPISIDSSQNISGHASNELAGVIVDNRWKVTFEKMSIKRELAERIDSFFDKYGYKTDKVKVPELQTSGMYRQNWVYLKTEGCILLNPLMPSDDAEKIRSIYDSGITFWKPAAFGNYSLSNLPVNAVGAAIPFGAG